MWPGQVTGREADVWPQRSLDKWSAGKVAEVLPGIWIILNVEGRSCDGRDTEALAMSQS